VCEYPCVRNSDCCASGNSAGQYASPGCGANGFCE
jgi:hypothetical protein